ncbi:MAG: insulinase family protein [Candidatus Tectomicrobia bacterium]|nr:insulinase family protein [Candidatus Tectomicrobia bacterium]
MKKTQLPNGLTVILEENHAAPVVSLQMWVKVGSALEQPHESGLAHLFEHMLFKGTERRGVGEIGMQVEACGGDINAYTSYDETVYYLVLASRFFPTGLDILADAIQHSAFDPAELAKEEEVVIEEIRRSEDMPSRRLSQKVFSTSYRVHPYQRPIIGTEESVRGFTREQILDFYRRWYVPNNMVLIVVGDLEPRQALEAVRATFRDFAPRGLPAHRLPGEPPQERPRHVLLHDEVEESYLDAAFHIPAINHEDILPLDVASVLLGYGEGSRLYLEVHDRQQVLNSVYAYCFTPREAGLFLVGGTLNAETAEAGLAATMRELRRLHHEPVEKQELEKAKLTIESEFVFHKETVQGQARKLGFFEVLAGDVARERDYLRDLRRVTAADLQRVAQRYFLPQNLTFGLLSPPQSAGKVRPAALVRAARQGLRQARRRALGGAANGPGPGRGGASAPGTAKRPRLAFHTLGNGVRLLIKENRNVPVVAVRAMCVGGLRYETTGSSGLSNFVAEMLTKGTTQSSAVELTRRVEAIGGVLEGFSGRNTIGVSGEFLSRYTRTGLELVSEVLQQASFEPEEVEKRRTEILADIREQQDDLGQVTFNLLNRCFYGRHPYGLDQLGRAATVSRMQRRHLVAFSRRFVQPRNLVLSVVGDVDAGEVLDLARGLLGRWQGTNAGRLPEIPPALPPSQPRVRQLIRERQQAHLALGFPGPGLSDPRRYAMIVLNALLSGQGGRLFLELRDRRSLAYAVTSFLQEGLDLGMFGVYIGTSPAKLGEAYGGMLRELRQLLEKPLPAEEVRRAKKFVVGSYEIGLQRNSFQANNLASSELLGLGYRQVERYPNLIMRVRAADVLAVARDALDLRRCAVALLRPRGISFRLGAVEAAPGLHLKAARH